MYSVLSEMEWEALEDPRQKALSAKLSSTICALYAQGMSLETVAHRVGCGHETVRRVVQQAGVGRSRQQASHMYWARCHAAHAMRDHHICRLYAAGLSTVQIADEMAMTQVTVYRILHRLGLARTLEQAIALRMERREAAIPHVALFDVINSEEAAYWLGFISADGCVYYHYRRGQRSKYPNLLAVALHARDTHHVAKLAALFGQPVYHYRANRSDGSFVPYAAVHLRSRRVCADLVAKGIVPRKTYSPDLARVLDYVSPELLPHFVRGVFDGDGCICVTRKQANVILNITGNTLFVHRVANAIGEQTGVKASVCIRKGTYYSVVVWAKQASVFAIERWMYGKSNVFLERKAKKFAYIHGLKGR